RRCRSGAGLRRRRWRGSVMGPGAPCAAASQSSRPPVPPHREETTVKTAINTAPSGYQRASIDRPHQHSSMVTLLTLIGAVWLVAVVGGGAAGAFEAGRGHPPLPLL